MMTTLRLVAMLLVANTVVFIMGFLGAGSSAERPFWLPPRWIRAGIPLAVAGGLWFGQRWAWWIAVAMCAGELIWIGVASFVLMLGGSFTEDGAALMRALYLDILVIHLACCACAAPFSLRPHCRIMARIYYP